MKYSIVHPTARIRESDGQYWAIAARNAIYAADNPRDIEYIVVVHHSRYSDFLQSGWHPLRPVGRFIVVVNFGRDCLVDQCNAGNLAATGEILIGHQDDMRFPEHWDTLISELIPNADDLVCVQSATDGGRADLLTLPTIATRSLIRHLGMIPAEYESMFADDDWSMRAWKFAKVVKASLYFQHLHPVNRTAVVDDVYRLENRKEAYERGWNVFEGRKVLGFPRVPYPDEIVPQEREVPDYPTIAMCCPGDTFSRAWLEGFFRLGGMLRDEGYLVQRYMGYFSNVYEVRRNLAERVIEDAKMCASKPKYVFWLDSDNVVQPDQLLGLIRFLDHYPEVSGVAGWCWIRKPHGWTTSAGYFWPEDGVHLLSMDASALFEGETTKEKFAPKRIEHTGFPCFLMRYEALELLGPGAFRPLTKADLPALFDGAMPAKEVSADWFAGEDSAWCLHAQKAGLVLVADPGCKVAHLKIQSMEPDIKDLVSALPAEAQVLREQVNGPAVDLPPEVGRTISMR